MELATSAYTEINIVGESKDVVYCVDWLGEVHSGDFKFAKDALGAIAMDSLEFSPVWSGIEPIEGGTKIWFTNFSGISELIISNLHAQLFDQLKVFAEFRCLRAADRAFGEYILEGESFHSNEFSAEEIGQDYFELKAKEVFGENWYQLADTSYCYERLEKEAKRYEEE